MTRIPHKAWVLVGDGQKAMFFENAGDEEFLDLHILELVEHENPPTREQGANRPGRYQDGPSVQRSAVEQTDWHELEKERFAKEVADILYRHAHKGVFDKLVIVAPPATLGELRHVLHKEVVDRVIAELDKTLTNHPVLEVEKLLSR